MENKYYTPTIEDFHVGFEYEEIEVLYTDKGWYKTKENHWVKQIYDPSDYLQAYYLNERLKRKLFNSVRVKYLDKEDIESFGFSYKDERYYIHEKYKMGGSDIMINYISSKQELRITMIPYMRSDYYLFKGTIKNKSELKTLLKQLRING